MYCLYAQRCLLPLAWVGAVNVHVKSAAVRIDDVSSKRERKKKLLRNISYTKHNAAVSDKVLPVKFSICTDFAFGQSHS